MNPIQQIPATENQRIEVAALLTRIGFSTVKTKNAADAILGDKKGFTKKFKELLGEILTESEHITAYKKDIETFFDEVYKEKIDLSNISFDEKHPHFMANSGTLTSDQIYAGFTTLKIGASKYITDSIDAKRTGGKSVNPDRPVDVYAFGHKGGDEPDTEHLGESYDMFSVDGKSYMTINEYMLVYQFMWWKFKIKLDKKGWTRTSTLDSDVGVLVGYSDGDEFRLFWCDRDGHDPDGGPREVMIF